MRAFIALHIVCVYIKWCVMFLDTNFLVSMKIIPNRLCRCSRHLCASNCHTWRHILHTHTRARTYSGNFLNAIAELIACTSFIRFTLDNVCICMLMCVGWEYIFIFGQVDDLNAVLFANVLKCFLCYLNLRERKNVDGNGNGVTSGIKPFKMNFLYRKFRTLECTSKSERVPVRRAWVRKRCAWKRDEAIIAVFIAPQYEKKIRKKSR